MSDLDDRTLVEQAEARAWRDSDALVRLRAELQHTRDELAAHLTIECESWARPLVARLDQVAAPPA